MDIQTVIAGMTLKEKIRFCTGADFWHTKARPGVPALLMADGPHGLRLQTGRADMMGVHQSLPATCFPAAVTAGASWDPALCAAVGRAIGLEAAAAGVGLVLGPGCNIKRDPRCGRNFEYFSEDPFLAGKMAASFIRGQQSTGVSSCLKHFAANNQEYRRQTGDSQVDERALREIYLAPFEAAVRQGRPDAVMCAYNRVNGVYASDSRWLLTQVLREEWGFGGMVVTDWGALHDRTAAFRAGCDLNMPGGSRYMEGAALEAARTGALAQADVDAAVARILAMALKERPGPGAVDEDAHDALACAAARQGAVLLKNEGGLLPVRASDMVLIGCMARDFRYQGSGSSHINPARLASLTDALPEVPFLPCCDREGNVTDAALEEAAALARRAGTAVVVAGLPESFESEGFDRANLALPEGMDRMIEAVAAANPRTAVVLLGGGPMELPWLDRVGAVLYMGLPGQAGGRACADLLTGQAVPCGKLAETWPLRTGDLATRETFGRREAEYRESVYVGYRYYDKAGRAVAFPFGHGLSYTRFAYSGLEVRPDAVSATVTNTGPRPGAEVAQLYLAAPQDGLHRPLRELKGFQRVELEPGESRRVTFPLDRRSFALWQEGWRVPAGRYGVLVGSSSRDIRLEGTLDIEGERAAAPDWQAGSWYETMEGLPSREEWEKAMGRSVPAAPEPQRGHFTWDNNLLDMRGSGPLMALACKLAERIVSWRCGRDPQALRMMLACAVEVPLRSLVINGGGLVPQRLVEALVELANGRRMRCLGVLLGLRRGKAANSANYNNKL